MHTAVSTYVHSDGSAKSAYWLCGAFALSQGMDTGAGMKVFDAPVTVAKVMPDNDVHESGVQVYPIYSQPKYQVSIYMQQ